MIDIKELYWAAGFYEGEGCVRLNRSSKRAQEFGTPPTMGFQVANADIEPLQRFQRAVAGIGKIYGPYAPQKNASFLGKLPRYVWSANRFREVNALKGFLFPLLSERRKQQILAAHTASSTTRIGRWTDEKRKAMVFRGRGARGRFIKT